MKKPNLIERVLIVCRRNKRCSRVLIISWFKIATSTAYAVWSYLRGACIEGLLDTEVSKCVYDDEKDEIRFEEVRT